MVINLKNRISDFYTQTDTLTRYYNDIRPHKVLSVEEERAAFMMLRNGSDADKMAAKEKIVNSNQRFVVSVAKKYASCDKSSLLDIIEAANLGLLEAIDYFDVDKGNRFTSFAVWYIRRAVIQYKTQYGSVVKRTNLSKTQHLIGQIKHQFLQQEHRQPTPEEIKDILNKKYGVNIGNVSDVFDVQAIPITTVFDGDDDEVEMSQYTHASMQQNNVIRTIDIDWAKNTASRLLSKLPARESKILRMSFGIGYDREYEIEEIADEFGLTNERIRQLKVAALAKLSSMYANNKKKY